MPKFKGQRRTLALLARKKDTLDCVSHHGHLMTRREGEALLCCCCSKNAFFKE